MVVLRRNQLRERYRFNSHRLLHESVEEFTPGPGGPTVETESEFIKVVLQLFSGDGSLMGAQEPAFKQGGNAVNPRQKLRGPFRIRPSDLDFVPEASLPQSGVSRPTVRDHNRARFHGVFHKREQTVCGGVDNSSHSNPSDPGSIGLRCNDHQGLVSQVPATSAFFNPSHQRFIHLDLARKPIPSRPHHGPPQLLQAGPSSLVASEAQQTLQAKRTDAVLLVSDPPDGAKPSPKRKMASMEDRPGRHGGLVSTVSAHHQGSLGGPVAGAGAPGTAEAHRPAQASQVGSAVRFRCEPSLEFGNSARIILHTLYYNIWWLLESSKYPSGAYLTLWVNLVCVVIALVLFGGWSTLFEARWHTVGVFILVGLLQYPVARLAFYFSIQYIGATRASGITGVQPLFTAFVGTLVLGEVVTFRLALGTLLTVAGIYLIIGERRPRSE
jgi:uncharacterized membrane protein